MDALVKVGLVAAVVGLLIIAFAFTLNDPTASFVVAFLGGTLFGNGGMTALLASRG